MGNTMFRNREDAARQLADKLRDLDLKDPLVLGIPRGGVVTAAALARELNAEMDIALSRKLRHPTQPELAIGAVSEEGEVFLHERFRDRGFEEGYLEQERQRRWSELDQRRQRFREIRPAASIEGRSVILTDDGIATGSTMHVALQAVKTKGPHETILAVPVAPPHSFNELSGACDRAVAVSLPHDFMSVGQFYREFDQVNDDEVCETLRHFAPPAGSRQRASESRR